jgi:hypothetical protein
VLFFIAGVIFLYMLFFADPSEGAVTQAMLMGSVASVITMLFLLLGALDRPFSGSIGALQPVAMERSLELIDDALTAIDREVPIPCDDTGTAVRR